MIRKMVLCAILNAPLLVLVLTGCGCKPSYEQRVRIIYDVRAIEAGLRRYAFDHDGGYPETLADICDTYVGGGALVNPDIPIIPGSNPPRSYRYVPCGPDAPADTIILHVNPRCGEGWLYVLRHGGDIECLTPQDFEEAVRDLKGQGGELEVY